MGHHVLFTVNGTGIPDPFGPGFSSDCGRWLGNPWYNIMTQFWGPAFAPIYRWSPVGYPAAVAPMGPSVQAGVTEVLRLLDLPENQGTFAMSGYSQGALVTDYVWRDHLLSGSHAHRKKDCIAIINFGDPMRAEGISNGNLWAGIPVPGTLDGAVTGGIAGPANLTAAQTPDFLLSFNLPGDLYGSAPVGGNSAVGHDETLIFNLIMTMGFKSILGLATEALKTASSPMSHLLPIALAIWNGLQFAFQGTAAPHWQYGPYVPSAVDYLLQRGNQIAPTSW